MKKLLIVALSLSILFIACSKDDDKNSENNNNNNTEQQKKETLVTYNDVNFSLKANSSEYGRMFSTATGKMYKDSEVNQETGSKIDLVFVSSNGTFNYFESPGLYTGFTIPNATSTKVQTITTGLITVAEFDAMTDSTKLAGLTIEYDDESFGKDNLPILILFENAAGKKGAIKVKSITDKVLIADIKVQK